MSAFLDHADIVKITGKTRYTAQRAVLRERRIRFIEAANGQPLVRPEWLLDDKPKPARNRARWDRIGL
jgi:hypothetical protein